MTIIGIIISTFNSYHPYHILDSNPYTFVRNLVAREIELEMEIPPYLLELRFFRWAWQSQT
eukprot:CAMPEP_0178934850 /NCGR_PEP_ID=MMETSP0786-20121207/24149_1 /TAXON_ID=186022 /ORGANISM="Thalassionema frauenfeldii, Strain CCMP 1798" /LENGTH=60 /DNA_ID=CAMNT_0020612793 /DNA_START=180 /DNA_END=362 /DNA_ORIENTATION=+